MKKLQNPQEKKLLSYKKDCRNTYGERGSQSRYAIAAHKARDHRVFRRQINRILNDAETNQPNLLEEVDVEAKSVRKSSWRKYPDQPLSIVVERKLERRKNNGINATMKKTLISKD
jgi:hypothetical protein